MLDAMSRTQSMRGNRAINWHEPSRISDRGVNELERELESRGVTVLGKDANLIFQ